MACCAHLGLLAVIAGFAVYTDVVDHTHIAVVIVTAEVVFVYRARRCFHKAIAAGTM